MIQPEPDDVLVRAMGDPAYRGAAWEQRRAENIAPVNAYVERLRQPDPPEGRGWVPHVHSAHGGVDARVLMLFRDPGPRTHPDHGGSGFLSVQNDDPTAERMARLLATSGIAVGETLPWNVYPWWMNRDPTTDELDAGGDALLGLLDLLPALRVVVVHGRSAQRGWRRLVRREPAVASRYDVLETFHTSRQAFWHADQSVRDARRADLARTYERVAQMLADPPGSTPQRALAEVSSPVVERRHLVSFTVHGRPATFATEHEAAWRQAVRAAVQASGAQPVDARFAVSITFRTPVPRHRGEAWDLDNLVKPTLDAMEGVFGTRAWKGVPQPNDDRVDHLETSKRTAGSEEAIGADVTVWTLEERVGPALDEDERTRFWRRTRETLTEEPGVELEERDVFARALKDHLGQEL